MWCASSKHHTLYKQQQPKKKKGVRSMEQVVTIKIQTKKEKMLCIEELQAPHPLESNNTKKNKKDEHVAVSSPPLRTQQQKIGTCSPLSSKNQKKQGS